MAGRVEGKVAFITGAARGQGREHALRLAGEGADIIAIDICSQVNSIPYPLATPDDLEQTVKDIEALGRRVHHAVADVRDCGALTKAVSEGVEALGRLDIVCANAGIFGVGSALELSDEAWHDMIDINLTGVWHTVKAAFPHIVAGGRGGSMILTCSGNGVVGAPMYAHYVAAKHGVVGLVRGLAMEFVPQLIRVNGLIPGGVATDMVRNYADVGAPTVRYVEPEPGKETGGEHPYADFLIPPSSISDSVLFLASDDSRYITGSLVHIDGMPLVHMERSQQN